MPIPLRLQSGNRVHRTCIGASYVPLRPAPTSRLHAAQVGRRTPWWTRTAAVGDGLIEPVAAGSTADTAPVTDIELDDIGLEAAGGLKAELKNLVAPSVRLQQPLPGKERAALRTEAEQMMRDHKLIQVQIGGGGISPTVLAGMMDVLIKRQFVRIRCGTGGGERKALAKELERLLDCQCVHQIGHTITLYRQKGLARPRDCSCSPRG